MLTVSISNFKSVSRLSMGLSRAAVLIGPPASGKSNILEALALYGIVVRAVLIHSGVSEDKLPSLTPLIRCITCEDLLYRGRAEPHKYAEIKLKPPGLALKVSCRAPSHITLKINGATVDYKVSPVLGPFYPPYTLTHGDEKDLFVLTFLRLVLGTAQRNEEEPKVSVRDRLPPGEIPVPLLYSFDRSGAVYRFLFGLTGVSRAPRLLEDASNLGWILYSDVELARRVAESIKLLTGIDRSRTQAAC